MYATAGTLRRLIALRPRKQVKKRDLGKLFGYSGSRAWEKNKGAIMSLLDDFFEDGSTNRVHASPAIGNLADSGLSGVR